MTKDRIVHRITNEWHYFKTFTSRTEYQLVSINKYAHLLLQQILMIMINKYSTTVLNLDQTQIKLCGSQVELIPTKN